MNPYTLYNRIVHNITFASLRSFTWQKITAMAVLALAGTLCTTTPLEAKSPPPGTGVSDVPANILLMLDTSGSMRNYVTDDSVYYPVDVAFDSSGNMYIAKYYDYVAKYDSEGNFLFQFGGYTSSKENGKFRYIYSIAIDSNDNIYVSDFRNERVQKFDTDGNFISKFTVNGSYAYGVETDSSNNVYVVNGDRRVEKWSPSGVKLDTWNNSGGRYIAINNALGEVYVTNSSSRDVEVYNTNGVLQREWDVSYSPRGIEIADNGNIYVSDYSNDRIREYNTTGTQLNSYGSYGALIGQFKNPMGIGKNPATGELLVADFYNHRIQTPDGTIPPGIKAPKTRLQVVQSVVKAIVSDSNLTSGANFGMMQWSSSPQMEVNISDTGAADIFNQVDDLTASGGTYLDYAMDLAKDYFLGPDSPMNHSAPCQQNILIVLSDGFWVDNTASATAEDLNLNYDIQTFTVGFQTTGNENYTSLSQKGGTWPDSPLFADNEQNLLDVLSNYIRQIISSQLTFSTPTIIPGVASEDSILQSTFTYKKDHQWKGRFTKYALTNTGLLGATLWDAGDKLNMTPADNRKIWTVTEGLPLGLNNFTTTNLDRLRLPLEQDSGLIFTDQQLTDLIEFTRGKDSYNEFPSGQDDENDTLLTGERWKMADIYHSRAVVVGPPSAYTSDAANNKSEAWYRATNGYKTFKSGNACGIACSNRPEIVYVGSNSGMLHAFDSTTGEERWAFVPPSMLPGLRNVISPESGKSLSIYGVDGSPVVKDVYFDGSWKTVLMAGLRQGGHSYFALDITNSDDPKHLFTFDYNSLTDTVRYWNDAGVMSSYSSGTAPNHRNFSGLGEAWSTPLIMRLPIEGTWRWVALLGGGFNGAINNSYGSRLYVLDMEDGGRILKDLIIPDGDGSNMIVNAVPPRLTAISADSTTLFTAGGALLYFADLEGNLWKVNLTDGGVQYDIERVFNAAATLDNDRLSYHETTSSILPDGTLAQFYGTGDMQRVGRLSPDIENRAYGVFDSLFPNLGTLGSTFTTAAMHNASSAAECPVSNDYGWFFDLDANERISGRVTVKNSTVFLPRYTPNSSSLCSSGNGSLTELEFSCGSSLRTTSLGEGMPTEVIVYKNKVYIGISSDTEAVGVLPEGFVKQGNLIIGDPVSITTGVVKVESWRESD